MKNIKYISLVLLAVSFSACDVSYFEDVNNELEEIAEVEVILPAPDPGTADFSNYVALGASFSAGYSDGSVFLAAQSQSFPSIISQKMSSMGGGSFTQPLVSDNIGGLLLGGQQISNPRLYFDGAGLAQLQGSPTTEVSNILSGPFNNMGVPGAKSFHLVAPGYGSVANVPLGLANPYFARMASNPSATILEDAVSQGATFFTISEIGGNDVLGYATSGGSGVVQTGNPDPTTYGPSDITDPSLFTNVFNSLVQTMTANGAKGVVVTVPSIVNLPFFTSVPHDAVPLDGDTATLLNNGYAAYNGGLQLAFQALAGTGLFTEEELQKRTISFSAGQNAVVIIDEDLTDLGAINPLFGALPKYRQATAEDFLVLTSATFIGTTVGGNASLINGVSVPLADNWVLTPEEQNNIQVATDAYNASITSIGNANGLAVLDLDGLLNEAASSGAQFDEFTMTTTLVFGGLVSLDGIHLTTRGYALMAKKILESIDATYGSNFAASGNLPQADNYPTNYPPGI